MYFGEIITAFIIAAGGSLLAVLASGGSTALNKNSYIVAVVIGALSAAKDWRSLKKLPPVPSVGLDDAPTQGGPGGAGKLLGLLLAFTLLSLVWLMAACATLDQGADPLVVRMEQTLEGATNTLQTVVHVDQLNRDFWRTNVPAFHGLAETLRQPVWAPGMTEPEPWGVSLIQNAWNVKQAYKLQRTSANSNLLWTAWVTLNSTVTNAQQQLTVVNSTNFVWLH